MTDTEQFLSRFTLREGGLLARLPEGHTLPPVLHDWRVWIQDSTVYLNDLRNYVEKFEASQPEPRNMDEDGVGCKPKDNDR